MLLASSLLPPCKRLLFGLPYGAAVLFGGCDGHDCIVGGDGVGCGDCCNDGAVVIEGGCNCGSRTSFTSLFSKDASGNIGLISMLGRKEEDAVEIISDW